MKKTHALLVSGILYSGFAWPSFAMDEAKKDPTATTGTAGTTAGMVDFNSMIQQLEKDSATVNFAKGTANLGAAEQEALKTMSAKLASDKSVQKVLVAAWSDEAYPKQEGQKLGEVSERLAKQRADAVEDFLENNGIKNVETYSMAERPSWIAKTFRLDEAQVKGQAKNTETDKLNEGRIASILDAKGGASKTVILVQRDMKTTSM